MSLASIDTAVAPILAELQTKQAAAFTKNGKFAQLFASHDATPSVATAPKAKVDMLRDEDIYSIRRHGFLDRKITTTHQNGH